MPSRSSWRSQWILTRAAQEPPSPTPALAAEPPPVPPLAPRRELPPPEPAPNGPSVPWSLSLGADAEGLLLIESHPVLAAGAHLEAARPHGVSLRASFRRSFTTTVSTDSVGGRFTWTWARIDACPVSFGGGRLEIRPCVFGDIGEIDASGVGGAKTTDRGRPWGAAGLLGRVAVHVAPITVSAEVAGAYPINRESFVFVPSPAVYQIPAGIGFIGLSVGGTWNL